MRRSMSPLTLVCLIVWAPPAFAGSPAPVMTAVKTLKLSVAHESPELADQTRVLATAVKRGQLCQARAAAQRIGQLPAGSSLAVADLASLRAAALSVQAAVLTQPGTGACGGAKTGPPAVKTIANTPSEIKLRLAMPTATFRPQTGAGRAYQQLDIASADSVAGVGQPDVPELVQALGIPTGAKVQLSTSAVKGYTLQGVDLYPVQAGPADQGPAPVGVLDHRPAFQPPPFFRRAGTYGRAAMTPAQPASVTTAGTMRGLSIGQLAVAGAQYSPAHRTLRVITSMTVDVRFTGGQSTFGDGELSSVYEEPFRSVIGSLLGNGPTVLDHLPPVGTKIAECGEEMLIVADGGDRLAAEALAAARDADGLLTRVAILGAAAQDRYDAPDPGSTADAIHQYVQAAVAAPGCIHPSYLLLYGNPENVPVFSGTDETNPDTTDTNTVDLKDTASDIDYSYPSGGSYPDLAVGRIPEGTDVGKIIAYEDRPTTSPAFYQDATVSSYFQTKTGAADETQGYNNFVKTSEAVRQALTAQGKTVDRVYATTSKNPLTFADGSALPSDLKKPGFAWDGDAAKLQTDIDAGRFLVVLRDHGLSYTLGSPSFGLADAAALTNTTPGAQPVVWLLACDTGALSASVDNGGETLTEALERPTGGAVGVISASNVSETSQNDRLAKALADTIFPTNPAGAARTLGNLLWGAKLRLLLQIAVLNDAFYTHDEVRVYNAFGDPSMPLFTDVPKTFPAISTQYASGVVNVTGSAPAGTKVTLLEEGIPIGASSVAADGTATITPDVAPGPGHLQVALAEKGYVPARAEVRAGTEAPLPTPAVPKTNLVPDLVSPYQTLGKSYTEVEVKNESTVASGAFDVRLTGNDLDGHLQTATVHFSGLTPGQQYAAVSSVDFQNQVTVVADPENTVDESDETDNTLIGYGEQPDLIITGSSDSAGLHLTVSNVGTGTAAPTTAVVTGRGSPQSKRSTTIKFNFAALGPARHVDLTSNRRLYGSVTGTVDPSDAVVETREDNNTFSEP